MTLSFGGGNGLSFPACSSPPPRATGSLFSGPLIKDDSHPDDSGVFLTGDARGRRAGGPGPPKEARWPRPSSSETPTTQLLMPNVHDELGVFPGKRGERGRRAGRAGFAGQFGLVPLLGLPSLAVEQRGETEGSPGPVRPPAVDCASRRADVGLDARGSRRLREMLAQVPQTIILATHHYDLAMALCRKAVVLGGGKAAVYEDIRRLFDDPAAP